MFAFGVQRGNRGKQTPTFHRDNVAVAESRVIDERKMYEIGSVRRDTNYQIRRVCRVLQGYLLSIALWPEGHTVIELLAAANSQA